MNNPNMIVLRETVHNDLGGAHSVFGIDLSPENILTDSATGQTYTMLEFISKMDSDIAFRHKAGWHTPEQHPSESKAQTLWERLIEHTNSLKGHPALKQMKLKGTNETPVTETDGQGNGSDGGGTASGGTEATTTGAGRIPDGGGKVQWGF